MIVALKNVHISLESEHTSCGVTSYEAEEAVISLLTNFLDFTMASSKARDQMTAN